MSALVISRHSIGHARLRVASLRNGWKADVREPDIRFHCSLGLCLEADIAIANASAI